MKTKATWKRLLSLGLCLVLCLSGLPMSSVFAAVNTAGADSISALPVNGTGDTEDIPVVSVSTGVELKAALEDNTTSTVRLAQDIEVKFSTLAELEGYRHIFCSPKGKHTLDLNGHDFTLTMSAYHYWGDYRPHAEPYTLFNMRGNASLHIIGDGEIRNTFTELDFEVLETGDDIEYGTRIIFDMADQATVVIDSGSFYTGRTDKFWVNLAEPNWEQISYHPWSGFAWGIAPGQIAKLKGVAVIRINGGHFTGMDTTLIRSEENSAVVIFDGYFDSRTYGRCVSTKNGNIFGGTFEFHHFDKEIYNPFYEDHDIHVTEGTRAQLKYNVDDFLNFLSIDPYDPLHDSFFQTRVVYGGREYTSYQELVDVVTNEDHDDLRKDIKLVIEPKDCTSRTLKYTTDLEKEPVTADGSVISYPIGTDLFFQYADYDQYAGYGANPDMHWLEDMIVTITETRPNGDTSILKHIRPAADADFYNLRDYDHDPITGVGYRWTSGARKGSPVYFAAGNTYSVLVEYRYRYSGQHEWQYTHTPANPILLAAEEYETHINYSAGLIGDDVSYPGHTVEFEYINPENYTVLGISTFPKVEVTSVGENKWSFTVPNSRFVNVNAELEPRTYNLTVTPDISGGTITLDKTVASYKEQVPIHITPDEGMRIMTIQVASGAGKIWRDEYGNFSVYVLGDTEIKPIFGAENYCLTYKNEDGSVHSMAYYSNGAEVTLKGTSEEWYKGYGYALDGFTDTPGGARVYSLNQKITIHQSLTLYPHYRYNGSTTQKMELAGYTYPKAYEKIGEYSGIGMLPNQMVDIYRLTVYRVDSDGNLTGCNATDIFEPYYRYVFRLTLMLKEEYQTPDNSMVNQSGNVLLNASDKWFDKDFVRFEYYDKYNKFLDYEDPDFKDAMVIQTIPLPVASQTVIEHAKVRVAPIMTGETVSEYTKYTTTDDTQYRLNTMFFTSNKKFDCSNEYIQYVTLSANNGCVFDGTEFEIIGVNDAYTIRTTILEGKTTAQIVITHPAWDTFMRKVTVYGGVSLPMYEVGDLVQVYLDADLKDDFHFWKVKGITLPAESLFQQNLTFIMPDNDVEFTAICGGEASHLRGAVISKKEATCFAAGQIVYQCAIEGHTDQFTDIIPRLEHHLTHYPAAAPTCISRGYPIECWFCDRCRSFWTSPEAVTEMSAWDLIPPDENAHIPGVEYGSDENRHWQVCTLCGKTIHEELHSFTEAVIDPETGAVIPDVKACVCGYGYVEPITDCGGDPALCPLSVFTDTPKYTNWAHEGIEFCVRRGLMTGTSATTFEPKTPMTRAMLVTVLYRMEGEPGAGESTFSDVKSGRWYYAPVSWAADHGIVAGMGGGRFEPNGNVTREQMATILYRYAAFKGCSIANKADLSGFADASKIGKWYVDAMQWAVAEGLINGSASGGKVYLLPQGDANREQIAAILMRLVKSIEG